MLSYWRYAKVDLNPFWVMDLYENLMKTLEPFPRHTGFCHLISRLLKRASIGTCSGHCGLELNILPPTLLLLCPSCTANIGKQKHGSPSPVWRGVWIWFRFIISNAFVQDLEGRGVGACTLLEALQVMEVFCMAPGSVTSFWVCQVAEDGAVVLQAWTATGVVWPWRWQVSDHGSGCMILEWPIPDIKRSSTSHGVQFSSMDLEIILWKSLRICSFNRPSEGFS